MSFCKRSAQSLPGDVLERELVNSGDRIVVDEGAEASLAPAISPIS